MNSLFLHSLDYFTWKPETVIFGKRATHSYISQQTYTMISEAVAQYHPQLEFQPFFSMTHLLWHPVGPSEFTILPYLCLHGLKTQKLHALSQSVTEWYICSVLLSILRKVVSQGFSYSISWMNQEKSFCWRKEIQCPFSPWCFSEQKKEIYSNVQSKVRMWNFILALLLCLSFLKEF